MKVVVDSANERSFAEQTTTFRPPPVNGSTENFRVDLIVESNQHRFADLHRRCAKIACRTEHYRSKRVVIRTVFLKINTRDLLALGDQQRGHPFQQGQRLGITVSRFASIDLFAGVYVAGRKKLLRTSAGRSALAVVTPVDLLRHDSSFEERETRCFPAFYASVKRPQCQEYR